MLFLWLLFSVFVHSGHVYVASNNYIWRLEPVPLPRQIQQLVDEKQFELALHLAVSMTIYDILFTGLYALWHLINIP